ncbi:MAG: glycosyltransferase family 87 protein [Anaerolineae bacterium]
MGIESPLVNKAITGERARALLLMVLVLATYLFLAYGAYSLFTSQTPSGNDFYPRWRGTRALLLEGKDPYSEEVTLEIQKGIYGRLARGDEDQVAFAYPLYVSLFILPLALLPYPQAQALWLSGLVLLILATVIIILRTFDGKPSPSGLLALSLWCLLLYPTARSIVLGQFTILVLALVALALWAMQRGWDFLAGCSLALATIKPQMVFLLILFLLLWALTQGRRRVAGGFIVMMMALLLISTLILPSWVPGFLAGLGQYRLYTGKYTGSRSPLEILFASLLPTSIPSRAAVFVSLLLGGYLIYRWGQVVKDKEQFWPAIFMTIIVTLLIPVQTGTTNQVLLLLPLVFWLAQWAKRWWVAISLSLALLLGPWALFLVTVQGDAEQPVMFLPLPLFALTYLLAIGLRNSTALRGRGDATS